MTTNREDETNGLGRQRRGFGTGRRRVAGEANHSFMPLPKVRPGDQVAVISPSSGAAGRYPHVQELGLQRLREVFDLRPVEYPTTRKVGASLEERARDVMAAFADPQNKAIFASIGGDDQIKLIKFLDKAVFLHNPKPFFGYSDNTHLQNFLWTLSIPSYYGGSVMTQLAMEGRMHDLTVKYLKLALFEEGEFALETSPAFTDEGLPWSDPENLTKSRKMEENEGWYWDGEEDVEGVLWGGCLESLDYQLQVGRYLPALDTLQGTVLFIETAEGIPSARYVGRVLTAMGERGMLARFQALLAGRPKAWEFDKPASPAQKERYREEQRRTVLAVFREYNPQGTVVQNLDFGHTDPQITLPHGRRVRVLPSRRQILAQY